MRLVINLIEQAELPCRLPLKVEGDTRREQHGHQDAHGLYERASLLALRNVPVYGDAKRAGQGNQEDEDHRVAKLLQVE